jgi:thiosulfate dehydrogenase (quinone) large subunit
MSAARSSLMTAAPAERASVIPATLQEWFLTITRIAIGWMWWEQTTWKMPPTFGCPANFAFTTQSFESTGLCNFIGQQATYGDIEPFKAFLTGFVMPNIQLVGWGVYFAELAIAISLLFGILTRFGGLLGALMGVNLLIGFIGVPHEWHWTYLFLIFINLLLAVFAAGRKLGVDHWLRQHFADNSGPIGTIVRLGS